MDEFEQTPESQEEIQPSSGPIEDILPTTNEDEMKKLMQELDREQAYREHKCWRQYITVIVSFVFVFFQLYATISGLVTAQVLRATHLAFVQLLAFLLFPPTKKSPKNTLPWYDVVLGLVGAACWLYLVGGYSEKFLIFVNGIFKSNLQPLYTRAGAYTLFDIIVGIVAIVILFESCRRIVGLPIMIMLILVGVVLDTLQQIESHLLMRHYDGLMKDGAKIKGR